MTGSPAHDARSAPSVPRRLDTSRVRALPRRRLAPGGRARVPLALRRCSCATTLGYRASCLLVRAARLDRLDARRRRVDRRRSEQRQRLDPARPAGSDVAQRLAGPMLAVHHHRHAALRSRCAGRRGASCRLRCRSRCCAATSRGIGGCSWPPGSSAVCGRSACAAHRSLSRHGRGHRRPRGSGQEHGRARECARARLHLPRLGRDVPGGRADDRPARRPGRRARRGARHPSWATA